MVRVSRRGLLSFGDSFSDLYGDLGIRFATMAQYATHFGSEPVIAALYKPRLRGTLIADRPRVATWTDRVVVTWSAIEPLFFVHGVPPETSGQVQAVLHADGSVALHFRDTGLGDGIVGLFPGEGNARGDLVAGITDAAEATLPGHLDLTGTALYEANGGRAVIVEFTTREAIPEAADGERYSYRLAFDTEEPHWIQYDAGDEDFFWSVEVGAGGRAWASAGTLLPREHDNRVALRVDIADVAGVSASVIASAIQFQDERFVRQDVAQPTGIRLPVPPPPADLSEAGADAEEAPSEVFHYRRLADIADLGCRVVELLGDEFDLLAFHTEFRVDAQEAGTPWIPYSGNVDVSGVGVHGTRTPPCEASRLKGQWFLPVWMQSNHVAFDSRAASRHFDYGLFHFAHELAHAWLAYLSHDRDGRLEVLFGDACRCHWRRELLAPPAFPWRSVADARPFMSLLAWRENTDGNLHPGGGRGVLRGRGAVVARSLRDGPRGRERGPGPVPAAGPAAR